MGAIFTARTLQDAAGISADLAAKWHAPLAAAMPLANINTAERMAMFIAQCGHESGGFKTTEESLNYTPEALLATWPTRFNKTQSLYGRTNFPANQKMIGIIAYGGRMGNAPAPSDDGYFFRGRGLIQVTGKDNYHAYAKWVGKTKVAEFYALCGDIAQPEHAAKSAAWFWQANNLNKWADLRDVLTTSRVINLGSATSKATPNGLEDRLKLYQLAFKVMTGRA